MREKRMNMEEPKEIPSVNVSDYLDGILEDAKRLGFSGAAIAKAILKDIRDEKIEGVAEDQVKKMLAESKSLGLSAQKVVDNLRG